jgi:hypothetical protein
MRGAPDWGVPKSFQRLDWIDVIREVLAASCPHFPVFVSACRSLCGLSMRLGSIGGGPGKSKSDAGVGVSETGGNPRHGSRDALRVSRQSIDGTVFRVRLLYPERVGFQRMSGY